MDNHQTTRDTATKALTSFENVVMANIRLFFACFHIGPPHTDAFFMRCVAIRHDASMHVRERIVTDRNAWKTHPCGAAVKGRQSKILSKICRLIYKMKPLHTLVIDIHHTIHEYEQARNTSSPALLHCTMHIPLNPGLPVANSWLGHWDRYGGTQTDLPFGIGIASDMALHSTLPYSWQSLKGSVPCGGGPETPRTNLAVRHRSPIESDTWITKNGIRERDPEIINPIWCIS